MQRNKNSERIYNNYCALVEHARGGPYVWTCRSRPAVEKYKIRIIIIIFYYLLIIIFILYYIYYYIYNIFLNLIYNYL